MVVHFQYFCWLLYHLDISTSYLKHFIVYWKRYSRFIFTFSAPDQLSAISPWILLPFSKEQYLEVTIWTLDILIVTGISLFPMFPAPISGHTHTHTHTRFFLCFYLFSWLINQLLKTGTHIDTSNFNSAVQVCFSFLKFFI